MGVVTRIQFPDVGSPPYKMRGVIGVRFLSRASISPNPS